MPPRKEDPNDPTFKSSFVRDRGEGRGVRVAVPKTEDLTSPTSHTKYTDLKVRKTKLAVLGLPSHIIESGSPEYARCIRLANGYKKARTKELYEAHGYVSAGVSSLLAASSLALSASRYLYEAAAGAPINPDRGEVGASQLLKLASSLSDSYRQNELSAWELAAKESITRKRNAASEHKTPWLIASDTAAVVASVEGAPKRGRPRKVSLVQEANEERIGGPDDVFPPVAEFTEGEE